MAERPIKSLDDLMDGGVAERFNHELAKVWANVYDPNTDARKARAVVLTVKVTPNERRDACDFRVSVQSKLAPQVDLSQTVMITQRDDGSVLATERTDQLPGQIDINGEEAPMPRTISFLRAASQE